MNVIKAVITQNDYKNYGIGVKAQNMFMLKENGFNTPNMFCISAAYLDEYLRERRVKVTAILNNADFSDYVSMADACTQIKKIIYSLNSDKTFNNEIRSALKKHLPAAKNIAILSSAEHNDNDTAMFTHKLGNFLNVPIGEAVKYITRCFASIFHPEILEHYVKNGFPLSQLRMNVLVQEYSESEIIGTMYTSNPDGIINEAVIMIGRENSKVVDGEVNTNTTYYYNFSDKKKYYEKTKTSVQVSDEIFDKLIDFASRIKDLFGGHLRVGFSVNGKEVKILDAHYMLNFRADNPIILDSHSLGKAMRGVCLPLTESFTSRIYSNAYYALANEFIRSSGIISDFNDELTNIINASNGRLYYNLTNINKLLTLLPINSTVGILRSVLGIDSSDFYSKTSIFDEMNFFTWIFTSIRFLKRFYRSEKLEEKFIENIISNFTILETFDYSVMQAEELVALLEDAMTKFSEEWSAVILSEISYHLCMRKLRHHLIAVGVRDVQTYLKPLMFKGDNQAFKKDLGKLCVSVVNHGLKLEFSRFTNSMQFNNFLAEDKTGFANDWERFIEAQGKHCEGVFRLEGRDFSTDPLSLIKQVNEIISNQDKLREYMEIKPVKKPDFIIPPVKGFRRKMIEYYAKRIQTINETREKITMLKIQGYCEARNIFHYLGDILVGAKVINNISDIFYMRVGEVTDCITQGDNLEEYSKTMQKIIDKRKDEYEKFYDLPDNPKLIFANQVFNKKVVNAQYDGVDVIEDNDYYLGQYGVLAGEEVEDSDIGDNYDRKTDNFSETSGEFETDKETLPQSPEKSQSIQEGSLQVPENLNETFQNPPKADETYAVNEEARDQAKAIAAILGGGALSPEEEEARAIMEAARRDFEKNKGNLNTDKIEKTKLNINQIRDRF